MSGAAVAPARQSARIKQREQAAAAQATGAEPGSGKPGQSSSSGGSRETAPGTTAKSRDIQLVQTLIERCLQLYMPQKIIARASAQFKLARNAAWHVYAAHKDVIQTLQAQARIEPGFTRLVWQKLEEQNNEFFQAYYLRLQLKEHMVMFNHLLEQQQAMMAQLHSSWMQAMPTLMPMPGGAGGPVPFLPGMLPSNMNPGSDPAMQPAANGMGPAAANKHMASAGAAAAGLQAPVGSSLLLSPLDPASLLGADDVLLIDSHSHDLNQGGSNELLQPLDDTAFANGRLSPAMHRQGSRVGDPDADLIHVGEDLMDGLKFEAGDHDGPGDHIMLDHVGVQGTLDHHKFSMSDLKGWADEADFGQHAGMHTLDDSALAGHGTQQGPGHTHSGGAHDSSSPGMAGTAQRVKAAEDTSMSLPHLHGGTMHDVEPLAQPHGEMAHDDMDTAMEGLVVGDSDEVQAAFATDDVSGAGALHLSDLPGLDF